MKDTARTSSAQDDKAVDEIDELFSRLEQFEPPADMVARIMGAVSQLPLPQSGPTTPQQTLDGLVVNKCDQQPS